MPLVKRKPPPGLYRDRIWQLSKDALCGPLPKGLSRLARAIGLGMAVGNQVATVWLVRE